MRRIVLFVSSLALFLLLLCLGRLGAQQAGGPQHRDLVLELGTPATLYLPYGGTARSAPPADPADRAPAVVLVHGFASDRANMSPLARTLAVAGYAVLAVDVAGHGANRSGRFEHASAQPGPFFDELESAVHYLRVSRHVDGERIAMAGHSMGARSTLAYASLDPTLDAAVMISGGGYIPGPHRPANALFLYAEGDPERIRDGAAETASALAVELGGDPDLARDELRGNFEHGTAVRHSEVAGVDHVSVVLADVTAESVVAWLDAVMGRERRAPVGLSDPRLATAGLGLLLVVLVLPGLGIVLGRATSGGTPVPQAGNAAPMDLAALALGLVASIPLVAVGSPLPALSLVLGDLAIPYLAAAGAIALGVLSLRGRFDLRATSRAPARDVACALLALFAAMLLVTPLGVAFHGLTLSPERLVIAAASTLLLLPLFVAIESGVRRVDSWTGVAFSLVARVLVIAALGAGTSLGVLPRVVNFMLPILAVLILVLELPAACARSAAKPGGAGGSALAASLFQAALLAWILAAVLPVRV